MCHAAGCLYAGPHNSPVAVVCGRVESAERIGAAGYLHVLDDRGPTGHRGAPVSHGWQ